MTQEEKAKAYDKAIKKLHEIITMDNKPVIPKEIGEYLFPELRESEDEKIRKAIINIFATHKDYEVYFGVSVEDILAWLEKQGEQKLADKVKPKFNVGDWVVQSGIGIYKIVEVCESWYEVISYKDEMQYSIGFDKEDDCHLWTIEDAKDGDVFACGNDIVIFKGNNYNLEDKSGCMFVHCSIQNNRGYWYTIGSINPTFYKPATKEQRDLLFQKMKEAGYEWDAKKKELKKIGNKNPMLSDFFKYEYERGKADAQKSTEWSEGDEKMLNQIISIIKDADDDLIRTENISIYTNWLKSKMQPQLKWKPSELQIEALESATENCAYSEYQDCLKELIIELKKLKG